MQIMCVGILMIYFLIVPFVEKTEKHVNMLGER